jgi:hypothetical protein
VEKYDLSVNSGMCGVVRGIKLLKLILIMNWNDYVMIPGDYWEAEGQLLELELV